MAEILAENLSGKTVMGDDGAELGLLYNITMSMKTGQLGHLIVDPENRPVTDDFERDEHGHYLVPVSNVQAVKDHIVVRRQMRVLDASVFINEYDVSGDVATIPAVREELEDASGYRFDALEGGGMRLHVPDSGTVERVQRAARTTGDAEELSRTDVRLLAAAFELDATLVTDDYAMQNVAAELDIAVEVVAQDGIAERRDWQFQCQGCGRVYDEHRDRCEICGADLTRKNPT